MTLAIAAHSLPAAALIDPTLAAWARARSVSVTAHDGRDLDLVRRHRIRPVQVVYRCGPDSAATRRAVGLGVRRFVVCTAHQMARLDECAAGTRYLYLDERAPLMLGCCGATITCARQPSSTSSIGPCARSATSVTCPDRW